MIAHPLANLFPLLPDDELAALSKDIRENGLHDPIVTHEGMVLDGRNRQRACELAGIEPRFEELPPGTDPVAFVVSKNVARRHLSVSQRAMIAAQITTLRVGRPSKIAGIPAISQADAAKTLGVSRDSVQQAVRVTQDGISEVVTAVTQGTLKLHKASEIAELPPEVQRQAVNPPPVTTRPLDPRVEQILRKQKKPKSAPPKPPAKVAQDKPSAPPPFRTFAARIADSMADEIAFVNENELSTIAMWTELERADALRLLAELRGKIDALIAAIDGGGAA